MKQADQQYDIDAADELFSNWKERQQLLGTTAEAEKSQRKQQVKAAATLNNAFDSSFTSISY